MGFFALISGEFQRLKELEGLFPKLKKEGGGSKLNEPLLFEKYIKELNSCNYGSYAECESAEFIKGMRFYYLKNFDTKEDLVRKNNHAKTKRRTKFRR